MGELAKEILPVNIEDELKQSYDERNCRSGTA